MKYISTVSEQVLELINIKLIECRVLECVHVYTASTVNCKLNLLSISTEVAATLLTTLPTLLYFVYIIYIYFGVCRPRNGGKKSVHIIESIPHKSRQDMKQMLCLSLLADVLLNVLELLQKSLATLLLT